MVEVIGKSESVSKTVTCGSCGNILKYWPKDVQRQDNGRDMGGGSDGYEYVNCPCGSRAKIRSW